MLKACTLVCTLAASGWSPSLAAQDDTDRDDVAVVVTKKATAEEIEKHLTQVKASLLPKVWPPKCDRDVIERRKYLKEWQAVTSEHYIVFTNGPTASCKKYAVTLEDLYRTIKKDLPFEDIDRLLVAYIFDDAEDYYRYAERISGYSAEGARRTAGHANSMFYATYYSSPRDEVVFHEASHEIVGACLKVGGVGSWFQEGMAVYFENKMTNGTVEGDIKSDIKRGSWYPLEEFFAITSLLGDPMGNGHRNYDHAGALLDFMINTKLPPVAGKFGDFLSAARKGYGYERGAGISARLIKTAYGLSVEEFEAVWLRHLKLKQQ